jgi:NAD(P)-dependent dehydrogenase (short-subunit alcohol dehydrogenase family)
LVVARICQPAVVLEPLADGIERRQAGKDPLPSSVVGVIEAGQKKFQIVMAGHSNAENFARNTPMYGRPSEETEARHGGRIPLGRIGQPQDLVGATVFLASDAAAYITGQVLHVNGGMIMSD